VDKIRIDGIKISGELALVNLAGHPRCRYALFRACGILASHRINMPFVSAICSGDRSRASLCVEAEECALVKALLEHDPDLEGHIDFISSVGLLSVFPHRFSLRVLGLSLNALGRAGLAVHGLTSSLAPLTFVMDHDTLDEAAAALQTVLELPPGQKPIRTHFQVRQSPIRPDEDPQWR
jgi:aspartokinase